MHQKCITFFYDASQTKITDNWENLEDFEKISKSENLWIFWKKIHSSLLHRFLLHHVKIMFNLVHHWCSDAVNYCTNENTGPIITNFWILGWYARYRALVFEFMLVTLKMLCMTILLMSTGTLVTACTHYTVPDKPRNIVQYQQVIIKIFPRASLLICLANY